MSRKSGASRSRASTTSWTRGAARGLSEWRRRRYVEREARYQAEIEMRKREIIREEEGRDS